MAVSRRRLIAGAVVGLALFGAWWLARPQVLHPAADAVQAGPAMVRQSTPGAARTSFAPAASPQGPAAAHDAASGASPGVGASAPGTPDTAAMGLPEVQQVCGVGSVRIRDVAAARRQSLEVLPPALGLYARREAWPRVLARLDAGTDRARATALVLRASGLLDAEATIAPQAQLPDAAAAADAAVRQLAVLATGTADASVLRLALLACQSRAQTQECRALSPRDLVRLAPEDGSHWLQLAAAEPAERDAALLRAAQSARFSPTPSLVAHVDAAMPQDVPPYLRADLLLQALGVESGLLFDFALFSALRPCASGDVPRAVCTQLADAMAARGQSLTILAAAESLGRRSGGWPAERSKAVVAERDALVLELVTADADFQVHGCNAVARRRRLLLDIAAMGERAALQQRLEDGRAAASASQPLR